MDIGRWQAVQACLDLATRFYHFLDRGDAQHVAASFTSDAVWIRQNGEVCGQDAILTAVQARSAGMATRHLLANVVVDLDGEDAARITYELSVYLRHGDAPPKLAAVLTGEDRAIRVDGQWRFAFKRAQPFFAFP